MGDWYETIVDPVVEANEADILAEKVVSELVSAGLVKSEQTDCTLGDIGYPPAPGVLKYLREPDDMLMRLRTNGLEVVTRRSVHLAADLERILCPACGSPVEDLSKLHWQEAVGQWYDGGDGPLTCPACFQDASVATWIHEPTCGFGNLAFTFWNWPPFTSVYWTKTPRQFIEMATGHQCILVTGKL